MSTENLALLHVGKTVARFVEPPAATGYGPEDRRRIQLWCNRIEEAALRLLDDHDGKLLEVVVCTREYFDQLRASPPAAPRAPDAPSDEPTITGSEPQPWDDAETLDRYAEKMDRVAASKNQANAVGPIFRSIAQRIRSRLAASRSQPAPARTFSEEDVTRVAQIIDEYAGGNLSVAWHLEAARRIVASFFGVSRGAATEAPDADDEALLNRTYSLRTIEGGHELPLTGRALLSNFRLHEQLQEERRTKTTGHEDAK